MVLRPYPAQRCCARTRRSGAAPVPGAMVLRPYPVQPDARRAAPKEAISIGLVFIQPVPAGPQSGGADGT